MSEHQSTRAIAGIAAPIVLMAIGAGLIIFALSYWRVTGWGALIWFAGFVGQIIIRAPHARRNAKNQIVDDKKDASERLMLGAMFLTMVIFPLVHLATGLFSFADYVLPDWATAVGAVLQVPFLWLFWRSHADLGQNWSATLEVRAEHKLVTHGVYARVRHPMYSAIWLCALAQPMLIHNWIAGLLVIPAFAVMSIFRIPREEAMMRETFGADYDAYSERTGQLVPKIATSGGRP